jgi:nicotinate dehydrogenase FAD-subunit
VNQIDYVRPNDLKQVLETLDRLGASSKVLAGGTDLVRQLGTRQDGLKQLVDVADVSELKQIEMTSEGKIFLGAAVTLAEVLENKELTEAVPLLAEGCRVVGGPQIRNQATPGGNVANGAACADIATVLVCLGATAHIARLSGERQVPVEQLVSNLPRELPPGSLIHSFEFSRLGTDEKSAFLRLASRKAMSIARVSLAITGRVGGDGQVASVRMAWGAVFPHPERVRQIEDLMVGQRPSEALFKEAGHTMEALYTSKAGDRWSAPYKRRVVRAFTERGLRQVLEAIP